MIVPDMRVVDAMCRGFTPYRPPTNTERVIAVRHLAGKVSDAVIGARIGRSERTVLRIRKALGLPGLPVGSNRYTARKNLS